MDPIKLCQRSPYLHISLWFNPWGNNYPRQYPLPIGESVVGI
jgi:hypothetical protein